MSSIHKVLVVGAGTYNWYAPAWVDGLRQLGIKVEFLDYSGVWSRGIRGNFEQKYLIGTAIALINKQAIELTVNYNPDVILLYASHPLWPTTVEKLAEHAWVTSYHNDDLFGPLRYKPYFRFFRRSLPLMHSHHVYREVNVSDYHALGIARVNVLQSYYLPWVDTQLPAHPSNSSKFSEKVIFIGHAEPDERIDCISYLHDSGIPLAIFGSPTGWKRYLPKRIYQVYCPINPVFGDLYREIISSAAISLAFFSKWNRDDYTRRVFEVPAVGGFLLAPRTPVMQGLYQEDTEVSLFSSPQELLDKCRLYLGNPVLRNCIAVAGHRRCLSSGYDLPHRLQQWLKDIELWMMNR